MIFFFNLFFNPEKQEFWKYEFFPPDRDDLCLTFFLLWKCGLSEMKSTRLVHGKCLSFTCVRRRDSNISNQNQPGVFSISNMVNVDEVVVSD